jgi:hypothetical protein
MCDAPRPLALRHAMGSSANCKPLHLQVTSVSGKHLLQKTHLGDLKLISW